MMAVNVEKLADAGKRYIKKMDLEDMAALKICLLSTELWQDFPSRAGWPAAWWA